jgi:hypothetical protein
VKTNPGVFPEKQRLWEGAILGSIVHAIMTARYPELAHEQSWDGMNYNVQDSMGSRGTVSFSDRRVVGAFFDAKSTRNPLQSESAYDLAKVLRAVPSEHLRLAQTEALQYLLQDYRGATVPVVTAIFWNVGDRMAAAEPWQQVYEHGAHLLRIQLLDADSALQEWAQAYNMSAGQLALAQRIFELKRQKPEAPVALGDDALAVLQVDAKGSEGLDASREAFAEFGITLP